MCFSVPESENKDLLMAACNVFRIFLHLGAIKTRIRLLWMHLVRWSTPRTSMQIFHCFPTPDTRYRICFGMLQLDPQVVQSESNSPPNGSNVDSNWGSLRASRVFGCLPFNVFTRSISLSFVFLYCPEVRNSRSTPPLYKKNITARGAPNSNFAGA